LAKFATPSDIYAKKRSMATSNNPFASLNLDREKISPCVEAFTRSPVTYGPAGNLFHLVTSYTGKPLKMAVYENKNGTTTLSCLAGQDKAAFQAIAAEVASKCKVSEAALLEVSLNKVPPNSVAELLKYLSTLDLQSYDEVAKSHHTQIRIVGKQGDTLTIKRFDNGTLQLQGRHALLASHAMDFLTTVLPYKEAIDLQIKGFDVKSSVDSVLHELAGVLPVSISKLGTTVRAQLASALALTKSEINLADFGAVSFPALRGLEGFLKAEMTNAGFDLTNFKDFGEYFEQKIVGKYEMRGMHALVAKEPKATKLACCYTLYKNERHGIAHMNADPETSRVLTSMTQAKSVVTSVFGTIEQFFKNTPP
jgi:hypothetical protein